MPYRNSLRLRILISFVVVGAVLGPLLTTMLLWATYVMEERAVARAASARLQEVIAAPHEFALRRSNGPSDTLVLTSLNVSRLPEEIERLRDGLHEYETADGAWIVAVGTTPQGRYAVVEDIAALEQRERVSVFVVAAGAAIAMYVALWLGFSMSRRLLAPLTRLSERVTIASPSGAGAETPLAQDVANDEVGRLAAALDRYARRMSEALRREREFSADASHELRNPLAVIQNAAELIEEDLAASERSRRAAARVRAAAQRMSETVTALLMLAREDLAAPPDAAAVSVADCVEALLQDERMLADAEGVPPIEWRCEARPLLTAPRAVIEVIAANLIRNARQHASARVVEVLLMPDRLQVADDGIGVPPEEIPRIFERGARGTTAAGVGFGLGLSLVQRLCDRFGWTLLVDSQPGTSTRVEWRFG